MISFPNCKINLGLSITGKRKDGYHNIESVFYPVKLHDVLEIIASDETSAFNYTRISAGDPQDNLCRKVWQLIKKDFPGLPQINLHLHKTIPTGAGLGGGSSDATATLLLLNRKFNLKIPEEILFEYALTLGSDCPFFLINTPCFASGRGEKLQPVSVELSGYKLLLVHPGIHVSTKSVFEKIKPAIPQIPVYEVIHQPVEQWKNNLTNDFEVVVFSQYPLLSEIKKEMYQQGAVYASMSGTGSTIYGIFSQDNGMSNFMNNQYIDTWISL